jgi:hypothetical protein
MDHAADCRGVGMTARQLQIDFTRAEHLATLRHARLPAMIGDDGKEVSPRIQTAILRCLDDHGGGKVCWVGFETIAAETGYSVRHCKRAVKALAAASLLIVECRCVFGTATKCNHYRIVWNELSLLRAGAGDGGLGTGEEERKAESGKPMEASRVPTMPVVVLSGGEADEEQSALRAEQSALARRAKCPGVTQIAPEAPQKRPAGEKQIGKLFSDGRTGGGDFQERKAESGKPTEESPSPQPPAPSPWSISDRARVMEELGWLGYERREDFVREFEPRFLPAEVLAVLEEFRRNVARSPGIFARGPAVIAYRLRRGCWPVAGVKTPSQLDALEADERAKAESGKRRAETADERQVRLGRRRQQIWRECETRGLDAERTRARLAQELPAEWCQTQAEVAAELAKLKRNF